MNFKHSIENEVWFIKIAFMTERRPTLIRVQEKMRNGAVNPYILLVEVVRFPAKRRCILLSNNVKSMKFIKE